MWTSKHICLNKYNSSCFYTCTAAAELHGNQRQRHLLYTELYYFSVFLKRNLELLLHKHCSSMSFISFSPRWVYPVVGGLRGQPESPDPESGCTDPVWISRCAGWSRIRFLPGPGDTAWEPARTHLPERTAPLEPPEIKEHREDPIKLRFENGY